MSGRLDDGSPNGSMYNGFLLADGTGVGKTPQILTVAKVFSEQYYNPVLIVSKAEVFKFSATEKSSRLAKRGSVPPMPPGFLKSLARS
jgi:hypothetical protein